MPKPAAADKNAKRRIRYATNVNVRARVRAERIKCRLANREKENARIRAWRKANPAKARAIVNRYGKSDKGRRIRRRRYNPEKARAKRLENTEKIRESKKKEYHRNRKKYIAKAKAYGKAHPEHKTSQLAMYRAKLLQATPKWLTKQQRAKIRKFYRKAAHLNKTTGKSHHVDHIVPLRGCTVWGLHVPWNLQVLTGPENCSKGNRL